MFRFGLIFEGGKNEKDNIFVVNIDGAHNGQANGVTDPKKDIA